MGDEEKKAGKERECEDKPSQLDLLMTMLASMKAEMTNGREEMVSRHAEISSRQAEIASRQDSMRQEMANRQDNMAARTELASQVLPVTGKNRKSEAEQK